MRPGGTQSPRSGLARGTGEASTFAGLRPLAEWRSDAMKRSTERILTTHTGSLPRPPDLVELMFAKEEGREAPELIERVRGEIGRASCRERV